MAKCGKKIKVKSKGNQKKINKKSLNMSKINVNDNSEYFSQLDTRVKELRDEYNEKRKRRNYT